MQKLPFRKTHTKNAYLAFHQVPEHFSGKRLDQFLSHRYPELSRSRLQKALKDGRIRIDRKGESLSSFLQSNSFKKSQASEYEKEALLENYVFSLKSSLKASTRIWPKDEVMVATLPKISDTYRELNTKNQSIAFEDKYYLVIQKLPFQTVHATNGFLFDNLSLSLKEAFGREFYPCHRIDRETSGLLVFAKTPQAAQAMVDIMSGEGCPCAGSNAERGIKKTYLALVKGKVTEKSFELEGSIGPDKNSRLKVRQLFRKNQSPLDEELYCKTQYRLHEKTWMPKSSSLSLLECELFTGRQHQIRAQLSYAGHPILGDKLYGKPDDFFIRAQRGQLEPEEKADLILDRHALHAWKLFLKHPITDEALELEAPLPLDMTRLCMPFKA
jgi:RluA family pseudouridine synthase